jgi:ATP-dependent RNA helicase DDX49/DBP8
MELFGSKLVAARSDTNDDRRVKKDKKKGALISQPQSSEVTEALSFSDLGVCDWLCNSALAMGFRRPTDIQKACIPAIINGKDVMGCAETGSGKTAAFAVPILHHLSSDPYGIFAVVLTPTRELALQISEQFSALGAPLGLKVCLVIGGANMMQQASMLAKRPHIVIATPGRLRHHLEGPDPPNLSRAMYLVLDEADRLLSTGFESELKIIINSMHKNRKTLLFSATLTETLSELESLASINTIRYDLTLKNKLPTKLLQQYLFMPSQVKLCYLVAVLKNIISLQESDSPIDDDLDNNTEQQKIINALLEETQSKRKKIKKETRDKPNKGMSKKALYKSAINIMIFVGTCKKCQEVNELLLELGFDCVALHSMMSQARRLASLGKFKSHVCRILVATDVASRGLDIPQLELVINLDLPKVTSDYIHRVGRTARAGKNGRSLSLVTEHDVLTLTYLLTHSLTNSLTYSLTCFIRSI